MATSPTATTTATTRQSIRQPPPGLGRATHGPPAGSRAQPVRLPRRGPGAITSHVP